MPTHKILVTDITNYGDLRCVAGWEIDRKEMVRPEPHPGGFWHANRIGPEGFDRGSVVSFIGVPPNPLTSFPHRTEDCVVRGTVSVISRPSKEDLLKLLSNTESGTLDEIFDGNLVYDGPKAYVPHNAQTRSLGGISVTPDNLSVEQYVNFQGKDRMRVRFGMGDRELAPNLTSTKAYDMLHSGKFEEINAMIAKAKRVHLRVGLARAFPEVPDRCYMQINGIFLSDVT